MRIVHVIAGIPIESGGPTQVLREMSARTAALGHDVTVLTTDSGGAGRKVGAGDHGFAAAVRVELWPAQLRRSPHVSIGQAWTAWRHAPDYDVAHVHGVFALPPSLAMAAFRARGLPYVLRPCGMLDAYSLTQRAGMKRAWLAAIDRANLEGAARVQASTEHEANAVRALLPPPLWSRVVVLPQGVEAPTPAALSTGARLHARPYLLFLSRVARKKGLLLLIDAFAAIALRRPELDLVIAGPDEQGHAAEVRAHSLARGVAERVVMTGVVRGPAKRDWFAGAEAFVLPSDDENFGVVVVEAAHHGTPVVVSDAVGLAPEVVRYGAGVVSARDVEALASAIEAVLDRGRESFGEGARAFASAFAWGPLIARLVDEYAAIRR